MTTTIRVATDVGGTFTDLVYFETDEATGRQSIRTAKVDTTPPTVSITASARRAKSAKSPVSVLITSSAPRLRT